MSDRKSQIPSLLTRAAMESLGAVHLWLKRHASRKSTAVRADASDTSGMSNLKSRTPSLLTKAEAESLGAVHLWLKRHRRRVASLVDSVAFPWLAIAKQLDAEGIRNKRGEPPSADLVRKTWPLVLAKHAKKEATARAARAAGPARSYRPNIEPPSRPGYSTPTPVPPRTYQQPRQPPPVAVSAGEPARPVPLAWEDMTLAQRLAHQEALFDAVDGPRPIIKPRGKVS